VEAACENRSVPQRGKELTNGWESCVWVLDERLVTNLWKTDNPCVGESIAQYLTPCDHDGVTLAIEDKDRTADPMKSVGEIRPSEHPFQVRHIVIGNG
jgi:hypothetical protein